MKKKLDLMTNVVLLTVDSLRSDHCSCYGYDRETTPELDSLSMNGTRFMNAYSPSSHTRESVPAFLSGQYPHAAVDDGYHLAAPTLATHLSESHHTGAFHSNPFISRAYGFDNGFDVFDDDLYLAQHRLLALAQRLWDKIRNHHYARAESINSRALDWLDSLPDDESFFLWNHYMDTHGPYEPPEPYRSKWTGQSISGRKAQNLYDRALSDPGSITTAERQLLIDLYDGEIRYTDAQIQKLLDELADRDYLEETLVLVTSDHGDGLGDNGQYGHPRYLHDELVTVPLMMNNPNDAGGRVSNVPVSGLDIAPTVLSAVGRESADLPGVSLRQVLSDESTFEERCIILEARGENENSDRRRYRVVDGESEFMFERTFSEATQPDEYDSNPLAQRLMGHLNLVNKRRDTGEVYTREGEANEISDRLEALGYK